MLYCQFPLLAIHWKVTNGKQRLLLQWGSEYQTNLAFEWLNRGWMPDGSVFECHLNAGQMDTILFSYVLVQYLNDQAITYDITHRPTI